MASHLARFQSDDSLLGECDPWAEMEFFTPRGPGRAAYRPDGPLPKEFPRVSDVGSDVTPKMSASFFSVAPLRDMVRLI